MAFQSLETKVVNNRLYCYLYGLLQVNDNSHTQGYVTSVKELEEHDPPSTWTHDLQQGNSAFYQLGYVALSLSDKFQIQNYDDYFIPCSDNNKSLKLFADPHIQIC